MVAGSVGRPELAPAVLERMEPWIDLAEEALAKVLSPLGLTELLPVRDLAQAVVTYYLGANLLSHLDPRATATARPLRRAEELAPTLARPGPAD